MTYVERLQKAATAAEPALKKIGVEERYSVFKTNIDPPTPIRPPSQSDSKFQAEQALGDWAEDSVKAAINRSNTKVRAVHYGDNSKLFAEDEGFRNAYVQGVKRTYAEGKRSDLLLLPDEVIAPEDCTNLDKAETKRIVAASIGGLEVRSSRFSARIYRAYQERRAKEGKTPTAIEPSFTVKVEDLFKVYIWNVLNEKPQAYVQVFFDEVHAISFVNILDYIGKAKLRVEKHKRSAKTTIMIPISQGRLVGEVRIEPSFCVVHNVTQNGRHDIFARPRGGKIDIDSGSLRNALE